MITAISVAQGLAKIFELREAIRHQRRVNRHTYLQLTEIHIELQLLERNGPLQNDATLHRNATVKTFALAVHNYSQYLQKYNDLNRFLRFFKRNEMEDARQVIVAEIDQLFRMLGLATSVTMMNGTASAAKNAAKFLSKVEDVHEMSSSHTTKYKRRYSSWWRSGGTRRRRMRRLQKPVLMRSFEALLANYSVPLIMETLASRHAAEKEFGKREKAAEKEQALLALIRKCVTSNSRVQVYQADGIGLFVRLIREGNSFYTELYALHCLSWFTFIYSKMSDSEFEILRSCIREATQPEIQALVRDLQDDDDQVKEDASILCFCLATRGEGDRLRNAGILDPLVALLLNGTANQKLWSAESLGTLASNSDENCVAIARQGAIQPLVTLLRSGTDMQRQEAA